MEKLNAFVLVEEPVNSRIPGWVEMPFCSVAVLEEKVPLEIMLVHDAITEIANPVLRHGVLLAQPSPGHMVRFLVAVHMLVIII